MPGNCVHLSMFQVKQLEFASEMDGPVNIGLRVRPSISISRPSDDDFTKGMLRLEVMILDELSAVLSLHAVVEQVFTFDEVEREAFDDFMINSCGPIALREFEKRLDLIVQEMGFLPFQLQLEKNLTIEKAVV